MSKPKKATPRPESPFVDQTLDPDIKTLVVALRDPATVTLGSCAGHGKEQAYVDLAVDGVGGLQAFVSRLNAVRESLEDAAWIDVSLNWSHDVATSCDFESYPEWIMLSMTIESGEGPPSKALLSRVARAWKAAG
jgi:hypothetical protein